MQCSHLDASCHQTIYICFLSYFVLAIYMSTIKNAILSWADTPGIEILGMTDSYVRVNSPVGIATIILTEDVYEVESSSEQLKAKIEEIIERALAKEKAIWQRGHEWFDLPASPLNLTK